jgi:hypothetical protein
VRRTTADRNPATAAHVRGTIDQADERCDPGSADLLAGTVHVLGPSLDLIETHLQPRPPGE